MTTFTFTPDFGAAGTTKPRVRTAQFGDGYQQRVQDGINSQPRSWSLSFVNRDDTETDAIEAFFLAAAGVSSFGWTPPRGAAGRWVCPEWEVTVVRHGLNSISATFHEVFGS